jgi:hypothetical protein
MRATTGRPHASAAVHSVRRLDDRLFSGPFCRCTVEIMLTYAGSSAGVVR